MELPEVATLAEDQERGDKDTRSNAEESIDTCLTFGGSWQLFRTKRANKTPTTPSTIHLQSMHQLSGASGEQPTEATMSEVLFAWLAATGFAAAFVAIGAFLVAPAITRMAKKNLPE